MRYSIIHTTDLFHPHGDPDDHFDLALQYALSVRKYTKLERVIIDHPSRAAAANHGFYSPAVLSVAQLNVITGEEVPVSIGCQQQVRKRVDDLSDIPLRQSSAIDMILRVLKDAEEPVRIVIVGDCSDIAAASRRDPELFRTKCNRVYVNAGTGCNIENHERECNVITNPNAYAAMFDLPCPVYWCPCFHSIHPLPEYFGPKNEGKHGSVYLTDQSFLFDHMSVRLQNYFSYMFECSTDPMWLAWLDRKESSAQLEYERTQKRRLYSTAGILHAAGITVDVNGDFSDLYSEDKGVFSFIPINVTCDDHGFTRWERARGDTQRYILNIPDNYNYASALTIAISKLFEVLG